MLPSAPCTRTVERKVRERILSMFYVKERCSMLPLLLLGSSASLRCTLFFSHAISRCLSLGTLHANTLPHTQTHTLIQMRAYTWTSIRSARYTSKQIRSHLRTSSSSFSLSGCVVAYVAPEVGDCVCLYHACALLYIRTNVCHETRLDGRLHVFVSRFRWVVYVCVCVCMCVCDATVCDMIVVCPMALWQLNQNNFQSTLGIQ